VSDEPAMAMQSMPHHAGHISVPDGGNMTFAAQQIDCCTVHSKWLCQQVHEPCTEE
jgi:hypothetical protein